MCLDYSLLEKLDKIHPYPAKFPLDTALSFIEQYSQPDDLVFDPFVGSGTTMLAASILERPSIGMDINGVAVMLSRLKLVAVNEDDRAALESLVSSIEHEISEGKFGKLFEYESINHWFCEDAIKALSCIKRNITTELEGKPDLQLLCRVAMSIVVNSVSNQESDTRYAAVVKSGITTANTLNLFTAKLYSIFDIVRLSKRNEEVTRKSAVYLQNSKQASSVMGPNSVDLLLTSPPYPNTYDYYLYHKHRMLWLDEDFKLAMHQEIGSRREFSSLKRPASKFNEDLEEIFIECNGLIKPNAKVVIIIGDGKIRGEMYDAGENTIQICNSIGWTLLESSYTELDRTSRSFQQSFRTKGKKEHVLIFSKS